MAVGFNIPEEIKEFDVETKENTENTTELRGISFKCPVVKTASLISFEKNERLMNIQFGEEIEKAPKKE